MSRPRPPGAYRNWTRDDDCIPAPVVKDQVTEYIRQLGAPFTLRDLRPLCLKRTQVNRVLDRLHRGGVITRRPIPNEHGVSPKTVFLYSLVEGAE